MFIETIKMCNYGAPTHVYCRTAANLDTIKALTLNLNSVNCTDRL